MGRNKKATQARVAQFRFLVLQKGPWSAARPHPRFVLRRERTGKSSVRATFCGVNGAETKKPPGGGFCSSIVLGGALAFGFALANC
jgi:hypothetical protein